MHAVVRTALVGMTCVTCACHGTASAPDPDGGSGSGAAGLSVAMSIQPQTPGVVGGGNNAGNIEVDEVTFKLLRLSVTGDAAQVATSDEIDLTWSDGEAPDPIVFSTAPTGLYSKETLRIDGQLQDNSYWINGHVRLNGDDHPFKIYDRDFLEINLDGNVQLSPGGSATVPLLFELDHALGDIDFSKLDDDNGTLVLDTFDSYMPTFRAKVVESFVVKSTTDGGS